jgi:hypothetical protein
MERMGSVSFLGLLSPYKAIYGNICDFSFKICNIITKNKKRSMKRMGLVLFVTS